MHCSSPTLSEWNDVTIIRTHRCTVITVGFAAASLICLAEGGMCRPTPLRNYFLQDNEEETTEFKGSLLTNSVMFAFTSVIIVCQLVIELKRYLIVREEKKAEEQAATALQQIQRATSRMMNLDQLGAPRLAWQEPGNTSDQENQNSSKTTALILALKISRLVSIFGILPTLLTIIALTLENIDSMRPHGVMAFVTAIYGIVIPLIIIINNKKIRVIPKNKSCF
jgi:hypothetical protein